jgi:hypothetical protein
MMMKKDATFYIYIIEDSFYISLINQMQKDKMMMMLWW